MKNKQMSIVFEMRNGCINPNDQMLNLKPQPELSMSEFPDNQDLVRFIEEAVEAGYITIKAVTITDCDCEVE